jgi:transcriptional regulator with XRE-family HTH domain
MKMKDYIVLNENIRSIIKNERKKHKISGIDLSEKLGKSPGYISHIEKGVIKKIERKDLENLLKHILNIEGDELENYINNLLNSNNIKQDYGEDNELEQLTLFDFSINDRFFRTMRTLDENLSKIYAQISNKEDMLKLLTNFNFNLTTMGASFMLSLCGLPFYELGNISTETKKQIFNEILDIFNKYLNDNKTNNQ